MLDKYKKIATNLGIAYSPNIGENTLIDKIKEKCTNDNIEFDTLLHIDEEIDTEYIEKVKNIHLEDMPDPTDSNDYNRLIRVSISCLDPTKASNQSEIFTVGNLLVTQTKCVPYNKPTHITKFMYDDIKGRKYQHLTMSKDKFGNDSPKPEIVPAYSITVLDPISIKEWQAIANEQLARK